MKNNSARKFREFLFLVAFVLISFASFSNRAEAEKPSLGRCHMGYCSWSLVLYGTIVKKTKNAILYEVQVLGGESGEYKDSDYPDDYNFDIHINWNQRAHNVFVFCNTRLPVIGFQKQFNVLDFEFIPGVLESSANLYVRICHGEDSYYYLSPEFHKKYGYQSPMLEEVNVSNPLELFDLLR